MVGFLGVGLAEDLSLKEGVDIATASTELSEQQRQDVAATARMLDFLEEVLLASASGEGSEESVLAGARRLLETTGDILKILDTLRSLVADSDLVGMIQQECDTIAD